MSLKSRYFGITRIGEHIGEPVSTMRYNNWRFNFCNKLNGRFKSERRWMLKSKGDLFKITNMFIENCRLYKEISFCEPCECFKVRVKFCNHFPVQTSHCKKSSFKIRRMKQMS